MLQKLAIQIWKPERSRICKANNGTDLCCDTRKVTAASRARKCRSRLSPVQPIDRDALAEAWLRQRDHTEREPLPCKWNFSRLCEIEKAPQSWSTKSLAAFRAYVEGRPIFTIGKPIESAEFAEQTSWLTLAVDMQLATGVSLPMSSGQQKGAGLLVAQARTFEKMWRHCSIFLEDSDGLILTEKAWDLAHVGFRAERGIQAVVPLECPNPTAGPEGWEHNQAQLRERDPSMGHILSTSCQEMYSLPPVWEMSQSVVARCRNL